MWMRGAGSEWARRRGVVYRHKVWGRRSDHYCGFQRPKSAVHIIPRMLGCGPSNRPFSANVYLGPIGPTRRGLSSNSVSGRKYRP